VFPIWNGYQFTKISQLAIYFSMDIANVGLSGFKVIIEIAAKDKFNLNFYGSYVAYSGPNWSVFSGFG
jgi:hypothetical protein